MKGFWYAVALWLLLSSWATLYAGEYIYLATEKYVYPYPLTDSIQVMGYLRGIQEGRPVDITVSLTLPDGNITYLSPRVEFHPSATKVLKAFPFVTVPVSTLFSIDGSKVFKKDPAGGNDTAVGTLDAGTYTLSAVLTGQGIQDSSTANFWVVGDELLPSIVDTPRPIIDSVSPPHGRPGDVITVTGRNLRGNPDLVDPSLIELYQMKIKVGGVEHAVDSASSNSTVLRFTLLEGAATGDLVEILALPYWAERESQVGHLTIPRVVEVSSNAFPFFVAPEVTAVDPQDFGPGDTVTISGRNFAQTPGLNTVYFSGIPGTIQDASNSTLTVTVPPVSGDAVSIVVVSNGVPSDAVQMGMGAPEIIRFYPRTVVPGESLFIDGTHFSSDEGGNQVYLGTVPISVSNQTSSALTCEIPLTMPSGSFELRVVVNGVEARGGGKVSVSPTW